MRYEDIMNIIRKILAYVHMVLKSSENKFLYEKYRKKHNIHPSFIFYGHGTTIVGKGQLIAGKGSHFNSHCYIAIPKNCRVIIGKNCHIGHYVTIYAGNMNTSNYNPENIETFTGDIIIEDNCYIGTYTIIPKNVKIGINSIIGASSVVTKDIPPYSLAAGSPAVVKKKLDIARQKDRR